MKLTLTWLSTVKISLSNSNRSCSKKSEQQSSIKLTWLSHVELGLINCWPKWLRKWTSPMASTSLRITLRRLLSLCPIRKSERSMVLALSMSTTWKESGLKQPRISLTILISWPYVSLKTHANTFYLQHWVLVL